MLGAVIRALDNFSDYYIFHKYQEMLEPTVWISSPLWKNTAYRNLNDSGDHL